MDKIVGEAEILLSDDEADLYMRQVAAQASADVSKDEAEYQNEPKGDEQCDGCTKFVEGLPDDVGGYCTKVRAIRGPTGMIFDDGWCKFFNAIPGASLDDLGAQVDELFGGKAKPAKSLL